MGPLVTSAPPALWVLGCLTLLLWLWVLCAACHRYVPPCLGSMWNLFQCCGQRGWGSRQVPLHQRPIPLHLYSASLA